MPDAKSDLFEVANALASQMGRPAALEAEYQSIERSLEKDFKRAQRFLHLAERGKEPGARQVAQLRERIERGRLRQAQICEEMERLADHFSEQAEDIGKKVRQHFDRERRIAEASVGKGHHT